MKDIQLLLFSTAHKTIVDSTYNDKTQAKYVTLNDIRELEQGTKPWH